MSNFNFKIEKKIPGQLGRAGVIETSHGDIATPAFIVVGTKATVKALTPEQLSGLGAQAVLANTYHLYLEPGDELVAKAGGLQGFMNWQGPTFTDSGGFQVFSLGAAYGEGGISKFVKDDEGCSKSDLATRSTTSNTKLAKIDEDGVTFKSCLDGSEHRFTPERSMQIQHNLGADIIFVFDECTSPLADYEYQKEAMNRTHAWAERSLAEHKRLIDESVVDVPEVQLQVSPKLDFGRASAVTNGSEAKSDLVAQSTTSHRPALFGIVQGGRFKDLREESARVIGCLSASGGGFDGFGIGGSFNKEDMGTAVRWVCENLPENKPRHLLGIGAVEDIFTGIENGADTFDCVAPTREARNGSLYTLSGRINLSNNKYREDFGPIEKNCACYTCKNFSRAYLAHLFRAKEMLASTLASIHNLYFFVNLVKKIRQSILDENFAEFKQEFLTKFQKPSQND
jgi:queuine tRNA-ribosyltransferase